MRLKAHMYALRDASVQVQNAIAAVFHTRRSPRVRWTFDKSIEGAIRVGKILDGLKEERGDDEDEDSAESADGAESTGSGEEE